MYCSTCGAYIPNGRDACNACGTAVAPTVERQKTLAPRFGAEDQRWARERPFGACPRCSYRGEGISYFSRGTHMAALVGFTVLTAGAMGAGGVIYYLMRREHRVCPRCGHGWGRFGEQSLAPSRTMDVRRAPAFAPARGRAPSFRMWSVLLWALAATLIVVGIAHGELVPLLLGGIAGAGGWGLHRKANDAREVRRAALLAELQLPVLVLAEARGGRLTVTEVAAALGWTLPRAEKVLNSLEDGLRVNSDVTREGVIVYEFRELLRLPGEWNEADPGAGDTDL
ncbi:hypothetical protein BH23GEM3_BH23GEM3_22850 [soil metagenome]|nr:hypothetical protein [Gemmatimonadota bacterium]